MDGSSRERLELAEILRLLARLHRHKDRAYGDSWRKRGEVVSIFCNLARKYDRLQVGLRETRASATESLGDTVADLCVYAGKYLSWLAEQAGDDFESVPPGPSASDCAADRGPEALERLFEVLDDFENATALAPPNGIGEAVARVDSAFSSLEAGLIAQSQSSAAGAPLPSWPEKVRLAWNLMDSSAWLLVRLSERDPSQLQGLRGEVERMDREAQR